MTGSSHQGFHGDLGFAQPMDNRRTADMPGFGLAQDLEVIGGFIADEQVVLAANYVPAEPAGIVFRRRYHYRPNKSRKASPRFCAAE